MKKQWICFAAFMLPCLVWLGCSETGTHREGSATADSTIATARFGGYPTEIAWGRHLVTIGGCNDCHTPKIMTPMGPVPDTSLRLSGHPADRPYPDVNRGEMEHKGLAVTNDLTAWVGPWGVSFSANLTPDQTGIGNWSEDQFKLAIREGKWMGMEGSRALLPPMPWQELGNLKDEELKAIFAYLQSIKPVHNLVPPPLPPASARALPPASSAAPAATRH